MLLASPHHVSSEWDILLPLALVFFCFGVAPWLSRRLLSRFGVVRVALITFAAWPVATVWYALTLDSMDRHFVDRWWFGARNAFILTATFCFFLLATGMLGRAWGDRTPRTPAFEFGGLGPSLLRGLAFALGILALAAAAFALARGCVA